MIHLQKQSPAITREGISLIRMACVSNPFIRGRIVTLEAFNQAVIEGKQCCKKCKRIYDRYKY
jgi:hypothetical protein